MNSKQKGKRGELEAAKVLSEFGYDCHRGVQYKGSPDSPDVVGMPGIHIEVKRTESFRLYPSLEQSQRDAGDEIPIVMYRKNGKPWVVILGLNDFMRLYEVRDAR